MKKTSLPFVIETRGDNERVYDVYSRLLEDRIIFLTGEINDKSADAVVAQLLLLNQKDKKKDIYLYINSGGGSVIDGLAIYDTIQHIDADVVTVCMGQAASMAAILLASGAPGKRQALPSSRVMIHQSRVTYQNVTITHTEQKIDLKENERLEAVCNAILAKHTKQSDKKIKKDCEVDRWFDPEAAKKYGLIDEIIIK